MSGLLLPSLLGPASASELSMTPTSTTDCNDEWVTECLDNQVLGEDDSLWMCSSALGTGVRMNGDTSTSTLAIPPNALVHDYVGVKLRGWASTVDTTVKVKVTFRNTSGQVIGTETLTLHEGEESIFAEQAVTAAPTGATTFRAAVQVTAGEPWVLQFEADDQDTAEPDGTQCTKTCDNGEVVTGFWEGGICNVACLEDYEDTADTGVSVGLVPPVCYYTL